MNVAEAPRRRTRVHLPADVQRPFEVYVNGVGQVEGVDFVVRDGALVFDRALVREKVGAGRWTSMVLGIAGSYGKDDSVDVAYRVAGASRVAARLPLEAID
ncbi:MAG TPA: hypothetical protein VGF10_13775 [Gaiella sp.]|jgi:hypothetical protein